MKLRWPRNGWTVLAETCAVKTPTPLERAIALGMNVLATNTMLADKALVVDLEFLRGIPRIETVNEDTSEFGVRVPYDLRNPIFGGWS